jgi:hypothetical protein
MDQVMKQRLDPTLGYSRDAGLNDNTALTIDPYEERGRVGVDGEVRKVIDTLLPQWLLEIPGFVPDFVKYLNDKIDGQLGLNEIQNLAEFKATLQSDNAIEKATSIVGPLVKDLTFGIERGVGRIWKMLGFMVPQYFNTKRVMEYTGPDGITTETFDYDPDKLIPSHHPSEVDHMSGNQIIPEKSKFAYMERGRAFCRSIRHVIVPHTLHEITQTAEQMKWLQLYRGGFPLAPHDVAKKLNIDNYGEIDGATYFDRYFNWQKKEIQLKAALASYAAALMPPSAQPPDQQTGEHGGQKGTGGRPPSGQKAPKVKQKSGGPLGPRTTVSESG